MNTPSRKHHFVPKAYLAAFTNNGTKDGHFFVLDTQTGKSFSTTPNNVAAERDFNRVDLLGLPIDVLESALARFETDLAPVLVKARNSDSYPSRPDLDFLINFIAHIAVRNPQSRRRAGQTFQQMRNTFWEVLLSDENIFNNHVNALKETGQPFDMTLEETGAFLLDNPEITAFSPHEHTEIELNIFEDILQLFGKRRWSLVLSPSDGPEFVCSDYPIGFRFKSPANGTRFVGYGISNTEIFFPLGTRHGLLGVFENAYPLIVNATIEQVAIFNSSVLESADRQVFSKQEKFLTIKDGRIVEVDCTTQT
jgi:hypothetical protein